MQGQILSYHAASDSGLILGDDGLRYDFGPGAWRGQGGLFAVQRVDFLSEGVIAREIYPLHDPRLVVASDAAPSGNSSQLLGGIGIACLFLGFVIPLVPVIAALVLGLIGADIAKRHEDGTGLVLSRIAWIGAVVILVLAVVLIGVGLNFLVSSLLPMMQAFFGHPNAI
jgi:hypothetical protein